MLVKDTRSTQAEILYIRKMYSLAEDGLTVRESAKKKGNNLVIKPDYYV